MLRTVVVMSALGCSIIGICTLSAGEERAVSSTQAERLFQTKCGLCHSLERAASAKKTPEEWSATVMRMKTYSNVFTNEEAKRIAMYLVRNYGK